MTAQIPDTFLLDDQEYSIVGVNGGELFKTQDFGLNPFSPMTACWRGYICQYRLRDNRLVLNKLKIYLKTYGSSGSVDLQGPVINNVQPSFRPPPKYEDFNNFYDELNLEIKFTGGILIGQGFIQKLYVHMGFHPAWKYQTVFELIFANGVASEVQNVSQQVEELRNKMAKEALEPNSQANEQELQALIKTTFKLNYHLHR